MRRLASLSRLAPVFLLAACASSGPSAQSPATASSQSPELPVREDFDPQSLGEDLLLIQPTFPTPAPDSPPARGALPTPAPRAEEGRVYQVQLMALSNEEVARQHQRQLSAIAGAPIFVDSERQLFMVRAGAFATAAQAERLKERLIALDPEYADAYVLGREAGALPAPAEPDTLFLPPLPEEPPPELVRIFGWRVLIDQFLSHEEAERVRQQAMSRLGREDIDVTFKAPWYKVEAGHYRTEAQAQEAVERIKHRYPNALKVRSQILVPKEE